MSEVQIRKDAGNAGQIAYHVNEDGTDVVSFVGSVYGGPVVMVTPNGHQTFVTDPGRFGEFGKEWVEKFLAS